MGREWPKVRLGDHVDSCLGKMLDKEKNRGELYPYLGNKNVRWGSFELDDLAEMRFEKNEHDRYGLRFGDLIVCEGGEPGRCAIWKDHIPGMKIQKALHRIRPLQGLNNYYLHYWFTEAYRTGILAPYFTGTTIQHLTGRAISQLEIPLPPLAIQKRIASVLSSLDAKIDLNHQMNTTLETMAQALFKSWFVDFDPVIDNAMAAGNPIPEPFRARAEARKTLGDQRKPLPVAIQHQFPDRFVLTEEMGWVPEGWEVASFGSKIELAYGKSLAVSVRVPGLIPVYGSGGATGFHNAALVKGPGIIVGRKGTVGSLYWVEKDFFPIDTVFYVVNNSGLPLYWIYQALQLFDIRSMGEDSAVPGVNRNVIYSKKMVFPKLQALEEYSKQVSAMTSRKKALDTANEALITLRDTLLPKLLSGELRIPEGEQ